MIACRCCDKITELDGRVWSLFARVKICLACSQREHASGFWWREKAEEDALWLRDGVSTEPSVQSKYGIKG